MLTKNRTFFSTARQRLHLVIAIAITASIIIDLLLAWMMFAEPSYQGGWESLGDAAVLSVFAHGLMFSIARATRMIYTVPEWIKKGK